VGKFNAECWSKKGRGAKVPTKKRKVGCTGGGGGVGGGDRGGVRKGGVHAHKRREIGTRGWASYKKISGKYRNCSFTLEEKRARNDQYGVLRIQLLP